MENEIREESGGVRMQSLVCERILNTDLAFDFSLPDYQPEIKRLLRVRATVHPADHYIGAGEVECSGMVDYCVLYAGNDGALYSVTESGEYRFSVPMEISGDFDLGEGFVCDAELPVDMVSGRVAAPRKVIIKCRLRPRVRIYGVQSIGEGMPKESEGIEVLRGSAEAAKVFLATSDPVSLGDEIRLDAPVGEMRVIGSEGQVFLTEVSAGSGAVNCRGEVCLKLLICGEGENAQPIPLLRRIPFTRSVLVDGAEINCDCTASGICTSVGVTVEDGRLLCDVTLLLQVRAQRNQELTFLRDVYSTKTESQAKTMPVTLPQAISAVNSNFSVNQTVSLEDVGIRANQSLWDLSALASVTSLEQERGKCYLLGRLRCHAVLFCEGEVSPQEFEVPFRYECELPEEANVSEYHATATVLTCRAKMDGGHIQVDAEVAINAALLGETSVQMLEEIHFGEPITQSKCVYTVCYPAREDTLWSVAKRYHRPVSVVADVNALPGAPMADSSASLAGVAFLLV